MFNSLEMASYILLQFMIYMYSLRTILFQIVLYITWVFALENDACSEYAFNKCVLLVVYETIVYVLPKFE